MVRSSAGNNGNGNGELGALAGVITLPEKCLGKEEAMDLGEATGRVAAAVIPGGSLFLDWMPLARFGKRRSVSAYGGKESEVLASCPKCKTFETLWFKGDALSPTKRFAQGLNKRVYHDCGSHESCRLFPKFAAEWSVTGTSKSLPLYSIETSRPRAETNVCLVH